MHKYTLGALLVVLLLAIILVIVGFTRHIPLDMSNPATLHCLDEGGKMHMYKENDQLFGSCILPGGDIACDQWDFYNGICPLNAQYEYSRHNCATDERSVDVCHEVYQVVCGYDTKGRYTEYSNGCFACQNEKVVFWITGNCEE